MDIQYRLSEFRKKYGRSPKVLHIGNIANNAYINAKLLNEIGFECDVVCPNYYHIMACPEWEDALIDGSVENQFHPDWKTVNLNGFERQRWFVQGPLKLCVHYLRAKNSNCNGKANNYWRLLQNVNGTSSDMAANVPIKYKIISMLWNYYGFQERFLRHATTNPKIVLQKLRTHIPAWLIHLLKPIFGFAIFLMRYFKISRRSIPRFAHRLFLGVFYKLTHCCESDSDCAKILEQVHEDHERLFGFRNNAINCSSLLAFFYKIDLWKTLFRDYDIIQGYAIDPIYPYLAGVHYFAFEHGTLRSLPFDGTVSGSLTALAFSRAERIFVTNTDCVSNASRLAGERFTVIPHPYDERRMDNLSDWQTLRRELLQKTGADFLIFYPTRHDWIEGDGFADKANDRLLRAFAALRENGCNVALICCRWGHNVAQSTELLSELGCEQFVLWFEPIGGVRYERMTKACDVIADQFLLGAFGGITFRGLAAGRPVCTHLNEEEIAAAYGSVPPVLNCQTEEQIFQALIKLFDDPAYRNNIGDMSAEWIRKYHSGLETARTQARHYLKYLCAQMDLTEDTSKFECDRFAKEATS